MIHEQGTLAGRNASNEAPVLKELPTINTKVKPQPLKKHYGLGWQ